MIVYSPGSPVSTAREFTQKRLFSGMTFHVSFQIPVGGRFVFAAHELTLERLHARMPSFVGFHIPRSRRLVFASNDFTVQEFPGVPPGVCFQVTQSHALVVTIW